MYEVVLFSHLVQGPGKQFSFFFYSFLSGCYRPGIVPNLGESMVNVSGEILAFTELTSLYT